MQSGNSQSSSPKIEEANVCSVLKSAYHCLVHVPSIIATLLNVTLTTALRASCFLNLLLGIQETV